MDILTIVFLAFVQGIAELLPVSSSAHVIIAEKLLGIDPSSASATFLLVMLHTGTMFAVLFYFWPRWRKIIQRWDNSSLAAAIGAKMFLWAIIVATACTGVLGLGLKFLIEHFFLRNAPIPEIEELFRSSTLMAGSLAAAGVLIIIAGLKKRSLASSATLTTRDALVIGLIQGLCLPFRGFSRSGATISVALLRGISRELAETFSFTLAVVLTPPVVVLEALRLFKTARETGTVVPFELFLPGILGMICSCIAGLLALRWLSRWLEKGRWHFFGIYCLCAAAVVLILQHMGF